MKNRKLFRQPFGLVAAFTLLLAVAAGTASAASLYWSGNGTAQGGAGTWNTSSTDWGTTTSLFPSAWVNANNDTARFGSTAGTVTLGTGITVGGIWFDTTAYTIANSTYTLTFGAANNPVTLNNIAAATVTGQLAGSGNNLTLSVNSAYPTTSGTLTLNGTSTGGWSGATTINPYATLALSGSNQGLLNTTGITLNGGGITLTSADNDTEKALDRVSNSAGITANGTSTFTYTTTTAASTRIFAETIGPVTLNSGQLNLVESLNKTLGSQTLTIGASGSGNLTQSGTAAITFSSGGSQTTFNQFVVTGASATSGGSIIGSWATIGTAANAQTDYAIYNGSAQVVSAAIAGSADSTWTTSGNAYTTSAGGTVTLGATRTISALRNTGATTVLTLGSGNNLQTYGLLNGVSTLLTVAPGTGGVLTTPSGGGNLYLAAGAGGITVNAPINDNSGNVSLVASGTGGTLTLPNANSYSGGTYLNAGTIAPGNNASFGNSAGTIYANGTATLSPSSALTAVANPINVGSAAVLTMGGTASTFSGVLSGSGTLSVSTAIGHSFSNTGNTFTGNLNLSGGSTCSFASLGDGGQVILNGVNFTYTGPTVSFGTRQLVFAGSGSTVATIFNNATGNGTLTFNADISPQQSANTMLQIRGNSTGTVTLGGLITDNNTGSTVKTTGITCNPANAGTTIVLTNPNNTFTGPISLNGGTISGSTIANIGTACSLGKSFSSTTIPSIQLGGNGASPTFTYTGGTAATDRNFQIGAANNVSSGQINNNGTGALTFTANPFNIVPSGEIGVPGFNLGGTYTGGINEIQGAIVKGATTTGNLANDDIKITKVNDSSIWKLSGNNTFAGNVTISGGTLMLGHANGLGFGGFQSTIATGTTTVSSGATLDLYGQTGISEPITVSGTGMGANGALINSSTANAASIVNGVAGVQVAATGTGSGYSAAPTVTFTGGGGSGAAANVSLGLTTSSFTLSGATGYAVNDTFTITGGGGTGSKFTVTAQTGGNPTSWTVNASGYGYTTAPTTIAKVTSTSGTGGTVSGNAANFCVSAVQMTAAGSGYTTAPTLNINGSPVTATVTLSSVALGAASSIGGAGDLTINPAITGVQTLTKVGAGKLTQAGAGAYGATTISGGTLALGVNSALPAASAVTLGTATLDAQTYANSAGTLDVTGAGTINIGSGGTLAFADSHAITDSTWSGGALNITGTFVSGSSLKFGTGSTGLTATQLGKISSLGCSSFGLNTSGYLTATTAATISTSGSLGAVNTTYGTASTTPTSFTVSGLYLTGAPGNLTVTPPTGYEVSLSSGSGYTTSLGVPYSSATLASTTVYVRLAATTGVNSYAGTITVSGGGASAQTIATVSSTVSAAPLTITANNQNKQYGTTQSSPATGSTAFGATGLKNGETIGTVTLTYGTGALTATAAPGSTSTITPSAATGGSFNPANYSISYTANSGTLTVIKAGTAVTLLSSEAPSGYWDSVFFTATNLSGVPDGENVYFTTNGTAFSTNTLASGGATTLSITNLPTGTNVITVAYWGDSNYIGSTNTLNQLVTNHPPVAAVATVTRTAGLRLEISLSGTNSLTNYWSDPYGLPVTLTGIKLVSTNGVTIQTNSSWIIYSNAPNVNDQLSYSIADSWGSTNIGYINIVVVSSVTGTNSITGITTGVSNVISAYGLPGYSYILERATNLAPVVWVDVSTNEAATNGVINAADSFWDLAPPFVAPSAAFYQFKWQP